MFVMSLWALVAATIIITSKTRDQILVARVLNCEQHGLCLPAPLISDLLQTSISEWSFLLSRFSNRKSLLPKLVASLLEHTKSV